LVQQRRYHYRLDGYVTAIEDHLAGARYFDLDPVGRVTAVERGGSAERYAYDNAGNVSSAAWPAQDTDAQGIREYSGTLLEKAGNVRYIHDAQGRVVLRQKKRLSAKPATWRYEWDADDRLVAAVTPDGRHWRYRYDPLGRRIAKQRIAADGTGVAEQVDFTWDGTVLAEQTHSSGRATTWEFQPNGIHPLTQVERVSVRDARQEWVDEQFYSIVTDLVGSPSELVDQEGNLAWRAERTLWGQALAQIFNTADTPLHFPGQYHDVETGLNYNYHRYYDPEIGRYATNDPLGLTPGPNPKSYVHNPITWLDPLGLTPAPAGGCGPGGSNENRFPQTSDEMTERLGVPPTKVSTTPDGTPRVVWEPSDHIRIRMESHPEGLSPGDPGYNPRHHGVHYHVIVRDDPGLSFNNSNNTRYVLPPGYTPGSGKAFIPGEEFP
jgi:RHS repeat-associated protein